MTPPPTDLLRRRALRLEQDPKHPLYLFALNVEELLEVADFSRLSRDEAGKLIGYQRPEVKKHIKSIVEYLDGENSLFPNSIILALSSSVEFKQVRGPKIDEGGAEAGTLEIPLPRGKSPKPAWVVDGQQRLLALSKSKRRNLLVPVNAFVADDVEVQRDQFVRINSAKPLPRGLVTELLPEITTSLPTSLSSKRAPSALCELLNKRPDSPFAGLIKRPSDKGAKAVITDTALIKVLEESFEQANGCLFPFKNIATGETDYDAVLQVVMLYWSAVRETWPEAWGIGAGQSRLMHSVGIRAMGRLMDRVMAGIDPSDPRARSRVVGELARIKEECHWTCGTWVGMSKAPVEWDDLESTPSDISALTSHLTRLYMASHRSVP